MHNVQLPKLIDYAQLMLLSAIWGSSFLAIELSLREFSPYYVAFGRILMAALFLLFIAKYKKIPFPRGQKKWFILICAGILNSAIPFFLISWGQVYINSATAAIILSGGPFMALILSHFITHDEKFTLLKLIGVSFGFLGIFVLLGDDIANKDTDAIYGQIAVFLAVNCYIGAGLLIRKLSGVPTVTLSASMLSMATLSMLPILFFVPFGGLHVNTLAFYSLIFLALIPTAIATLIRVKLVQRTGVQFMSQVAYLIPLFTIFWSWLILSEIPPIDTWIALFLILTGLFIRRIGH